jgi:hypothetical protein
MHKKHGLTHLCYILYIIIIRQRGFLFIGHCFSVTTHCLLPTYDIKLVHGGLFFYFL